jgi:hypothetical protein
VTPADLVEILERIEAKQDWLVAAIKHLLMSEAGVARPEPIDELEEWLADIPLEQARLAVEDEEWIAPIHAPKAATAVCTHQHQVLVNGNVQCAKCAHVLTSSGLARGTVTPSGQVMPDPNPPGWARENSRGASSKNPGGALIPHDVG